MMDLELLKKKELLLENARTVLKTEFVGIDDIIDSVIDNTKSWFLFPELQERPLVISAFGLTGTGKTALVKRLATLLDIERDMVYFNFAEIGELGSWEIEHKLEEELGNERSNRMFVYDEFQYAATIDEKGYEKDKKNGLKPFWELLDSGKLHKRDAYWTVYNLKKITLYMQKINEKHEMEIVNGVWINVDECMRHFSDYERDKFRSVFNGINMGNNDRQSGQIAESDAPTPSVDTVASYAEAENCEYGSSKYPGPQKFFLNPHSLECLFDMYEKTAASYVDQFQLYHKLCSMNTDELLDFIGQLHKRTQKGYDLNFKDSIIFVLGNLDEAYQVAFDTNPDMSPDQFNKVTKKITVVDIKKALQKRFRNEQIARLGNIFLIYPAFSSDSFQKIIELNLNTYAKHAKELCGYEIRFTESIKKIIYKEAVFPTHGTRPIFSTIHEIVKSKLPVAIKNIYENKLEATAIEYSFRGQHTYISVLGADGSKLGEYKFKEKLQLENLRRSAKDEQQALVAVHESGHFVIYSKLTGEMPEKLCSKTASTDASGFLMRKFEDGEKVSSLRSLKEDVMVALAGYAAEKLVFGDENRSCGASADLRNATSIVNKVVRKYGLTGIPFVTTFKGDPDKSNEAFAIRDDDPVAMNKVVTDIINACLAEVERTLSVPCWKKMLRDSANYLKDNSDMPHKKMLELYNAVPENMRKGIISPTFYRDTLAEF